MAGASTTKDAPDSRRGHHRVDYTNPHGTIKLRATDGGKVWDVTLSPVARMQTRGLTEAMLKPGTIVTVVGYQHRKTATEMRAENISVDKKKVELR